MPDIMISAVDALAIVLALVALIVTILGFFASLKFYRDGMELQQAATRVLAAVEEKAGFIQTQVGGMFERTLEAAISSKDNLESQYDDLRTQLDETTKGLIEDAVSQIGAASETERTRIAGLVESRMQSLEKKVVSTQRAAERLAIESPVVASGVGRTELEILKALTSNAEPLRSSELTEASGLTRTAVSRALHSLYNKGLIEQNGHRATSSYSLTGSGRDVANFALHD